ncbi:hypothetical protein X747_25310 [Mesorhizobium sp. LNJC384A00]|nr:hypothetical protein X747_25310 [Mesorhizobium sp. LNJC384A00]
MEVDVYLAKTRGGMGAFQPTARRLERKIAVFVGRHFAHLAGRPILFPAWMADDVYVPPAQAAPSGPLDEMGQFDLGQMHAAASKVRVT